MLTRSQSAELVKKIEPVITKVITYEFYLPYIQKQFADVNFQIGLYYKQIEQLFLAESYYMVAIQLNNNVSAMNNIACIYQIQKKYKLAIKYCKMSIKMSKNKNIIAIYNLAFVYEEMNRMEEAKKYYEIVIREGKKEENRCHEHNKYSRNAMCNLGYLYEREKNMEQAKYYYRMGAEQNDICAIESLVKICCKETRYEEAMTYCLMATETSNKKYMKKLLQFYKSRENVSGGIQFHTKCDICYEEDKTTYMFDCLSHFTCLDCWGRLYKCAFCSFPKHMYYLDLPSI
jgi:tetratricopeptide (TPR) repeat protein